MNFNRKRISHVPVFLKRNARLWYASKKMDQSNVRLHWTMACKPSTTVSEDTAQLLGLQNMS